MTMGVAGVDCSSKTQKAPGAASVNALKQHRNLHLEGPGNLLNALERQVALAAFHLADIGPVYSAGLAHFFLGPVAAPPQSANPSSEKQLSLVTPESFVRY